MIAESDLAERERRLRAGLSVFRWAGAAVAVAAAHVGTVWLTLNWRPVEALPSESPSAVMVDLAPVAVAAPAPPQDVAPGPQQTEAQPASTPDTLTPVENVKPDPTPPAPTQTVEDVKPARTPPVVEGAKPDPVPPAPTHSVEDVKPDPPPPTPAPTVNVLDPPKNDDANAVFASPQPPQPKVEKRSAPKPRDVERQKSVRPDRAKVRQTTAPPTSEAQRSDQAAAPSAGASFRASVSTATWKGELMAHINRYKTLSCWRHRYGYGVYRLRYQSRGTGVVRAPDRFVWRQRARSPRAPRQSCSRAPARHRWRRDHADSSHPLQ
jgi:protein TonB